MSSLQSTARTLAVPARMLALAFGLMALLVGANGVLSTLSAQASSTNQSVASGTLRLSLTPGPGSSITTAITGIAPGATVDRYVVLTNAGTLQSSNLLMSLTGATNALTSSLAVSVTSCTVSWNASFACSGTSSVLIASQPMNGLLSGGTTAIASALPPGSSANLQIRVSMAASAATTTTDGVSTSTVAGVSAQVNWVFTQTQAPGATTNS